MTDLEQLVGELRAFARSEPTHDMPCVEADLKWVAACLADLVDELQQEKASR